MFVYSGSHTSLACTPPLSLFLSYISHLCQTLFSQKQRGRCRDRQVGFRSFLQLHFVQGACLTPAESCCGAWGAEPCTGSWRGGGAVQLHPSQGSELKRDFSVFLTCCHYQSPDFFCRAEVSLSRAVHRFLII
jgi:hypothetical protein